MTSNRSTSQFIVCDSIPHLETVPAALAASQPQTIAQVRNPNDELTGSPVNAPLFQPIFEAAGGLMRMFGVECVSGGPISSARHMKIVFEEAAKLPQSLRVHLNVDAATVACDSALVDSLTQLARDHNVDAGRIVVEVMGYARSIDGSTFRLALRSLRAAGFGIAIDDIGSGQSNYQMILECRPDFLKINRFLIAGIDRDASLSIVVRTIVLLAHDFGARVIAEGVEHGPEFTTVRELGIDLIQGPLLAPARAVQS